MHNTKQKLSTLDQIKKYTKVVADTSDFELIDQYKPQDATTNPSLILKASQKENYKHLIKEAISYAKSKNPKNTLSLALDKVFVNFGFEILKLIPGRVSIEVDVRYSFDTKKSIEKAKNIISLFDEMGIERNRILIKLASTYEGITAAQQLEKENIHCNLTLLFSLAQAILCAEKKVTLISPFVGRILDWYKKNENKEYQGFEDPGVLSVTNIYNYYKKFDYHTEIMGASFRNTDEIIELAGCDLLTISPDLLEELQKSDTEITKKLDSNLAKKKNIQKINLTEQSFRYMLNEDPMATEKLSEGIRKFAKDQILLEKIIKNHL